MRDFPWEKASFILRHSICQEMVYPHGETRSELAHLFLATAPLSGSSPNGLLHKAVPEAACRREECVPVLSASDGVGKMHHGACDTEKCV